MGAISWDRLVITLRLRLGNMRSIGRIFPHFFCQSLKDDLGCVQIGFLLSTVQAAAAGPVYFARPPLGNALHSSVPPDLGNCFDYEVDLIARVLGPLVPFELRVNICNQRNL
jgi:hypothetical protein